MSSSSSFKAESVTAGLLGLVAGGFIMYQWMTTQQQQQQQQQQQRASHKDKKEGWTESPDTWTIEQVIRRRQTIQPNGFDPSVKVPRQQIEALLESANWAPTHGRTEPWRFVIFESLESRQALGELDANIYKRMTSPTSSFKQSKYDKKLHSKRQSSYVLAICMKRHEHHKIPLVEEQMAVACAVQNMHLHATAMGLGCCWLSGPTTEAQEMKDYLHLGPEDMCLGFFLIGVPDAAKPLPSRDRKPIQDKIRWL